MFSSKKQFFFLIGTIIILLVMANNILFHMNEFGRNIHHVKHFCRSRSRDNNIQEQLKSFRTIAIQSAKSSVLAQSSIDDVLGQLSTIVQAQIMGLQNASEEDCHGQTLLCGHIQACGLGCQIQVRTICLMVSYVLKVPLIHDELTGWAFDKTWSEAFEPLGSSCTVGPNTLRFKWRLGTPEMRHTPLIQNCSVPTSCTNASLYPLLDGLPVPKEIGGIVELIHSRPWFWWMGQFTKFTIRLSKAQRIILEKQKLAMGFQNHESPIVGIHIRRTDKLTEVANGFYPVEKYMEKADSYFKSLDNGAFNGTRNVFLASDSHLVLEEAVHKYALPKWKIWTFPTNITIPFQQHRRHELDSIIRDLIILSECDYVVCTFSSNVCKLALEIKSSRFANPMDRVVSLEAEYEHESQAPTLKQKTLNV